MSMPEKEPKKINIGPYIAVQCADVSKDIEKASAINNAWALPGGRIVTTAQLQEIALRNGWKIG